MKYYIIYLLRGKFKDISSFSSDEYDDYKHQFDKDMFHLINWYASGFDEIQTLHVVV